jgi:hypothetical protein
MANDEIWSLVNEAGRLVARAVEIAQADDAPFAGSMLNRQLADAGLMRLDVARAVAEK